MLLEVEDLNISFHTNKGLLPAVRHVSFQLNEGDSLGLVGESGCGKSITNLALMGLLAPNATVTASKLNFKGQSLLELSEKKWRKIRGKEMGMIFQDPMSALNPSLTIEAQIEETLIAHCPDLKRDQRKAKILDLLKLVGIPHPEKRLSSYPHELSGGMAQRIMIAMTLAPGPSLLLADEPTTALDVTIQEQVMVLLKEIQQKHHMALIFVTHDLSVVGRMCDQLQVMYAGEICEKGLSKDLLKNPCHPYTYGLIKSLPSPYSTQRRTPLYNIPGIVPGLFQRPKGCQFQARCPHATEKCNQSPSVQIFNQHLTRCWYPLENSL